MGPSAGGADSELWSPWRPMCPSQHGMPGMMRLPPFESGTGFGSRCPVRCRITLACPR
jgi:hypothetical protein